MAAHLWLIGMMGSGKSSIGSGLAERRRLDFVDTDDVIAERIGSSIAEFWGEHGEQAFRRMESSAVAEVAARSPMVIATGGGVILNEENPATMRQSGFVVWLQATPEKLATRIGRNTARPLLGGGDQVARLAVILDERRDSYAAAAHATIATDELDPKTVIDRIEEIWNEYS